MSQKKKKKRVVGFHYLGPHAGEVTQGYSIAMKLGATKSDFEDTGLKKYIYFVFGVDTSNLTH